MRVLHLHYYGYSGGAGGTVTFRRLHLGLRQAGIDSRILCARKTTNSPHIKQFRPSRFMRVLDARLDKFAGALGLRGLAGMGSFGIGRHPEFTRADVVHIHRMFEFISYLALPTLTRRKPVVLTVHDTWAFTGHCYVTLDCERWKTGCGRCPHLDIEPVVRRDNTRLEWSLKNWAYSRSKLVTIAPSRDVAERVKQGILGQFPVYHIPNGIDTERYQPVDRVQCRSVLGIPQDKKVVLFAAQSAGNYVKGGDLLVRALQSLPSLVKANVVLLIFGKNGDSLGRQIDIPFIDLGFLSNERLKIMAFSCADVFLFPTRGEAFGNVSLESMACGTPVVSFRVGGVPDQVLHGATGYLAEPEDVKGFRHGILELLDDDALRQRMRENCRKVAVEKFDIRSVAKRHIELYEQLRTRSSR